MQQEVLLHGNASKESVEREGRQADKITEEVLLCRMPFIKTAPVGLYR